MGGHYAAYHGPPNPTGYKSTALPAKYTPSMWVFKCNFPYSLSFMRFYVVCFSSTDHHQCSEKAFSISTEVHGPKGPQVSFSAVSPVYLLLLVFRSGDGNWSTQIYFSISHSICLPSLPLIPGNLLYPWFLCLQQREILENLWLDVLKVFNILIREMDINLQLWLGLIQFKSLQTLGFYDSVDVI